MRTSQGHGNPQTSLGDVAYPHVAAHTDEASTLSELSNMVNSLGTRALKKKARATEKKKGSCYMYSSTACPLVLDQWDRRSGKARRRMYKTHQRQTQFAARWGGCMYGIRDAARRQHRRTPLKAIAYGSMAR